LSPENPSNDVSDSYVTSFDPQIVPSSNHSNPEKSPPQNTLIPENNIPEAQINGSTPFLVDYDIQTFAPATIMSPGTADPSKTPEIPMPHHHLPPLPSMQLLNPTPYKRASTPLEASCTLAKPNSNPIMPEKPTTTHQTSQFHTPGNTITNSKHASTRPQLGW
jgi:hypothetical protein